MEREISTINFLSRPKYEPLKEKVLATTSENKKSIQLLVDQCLDKIENGSTIQCANGLQTIRQRVVKYRGYQISLHHAPGD